MQFALTYFNAHKIDYKFGKITIFLHYNAESIHLLDEKKIVHNFFKVLFRNVLKKGYPKIFLFLFKCRYFAESCQVSDEDK